MNKPNDFTIQSDYASPANDGAINLAVTFPGSRSIPAGSSLAFSSTASIGSVAGPLLINVISSKDNRLFSTNYLSIERTGSGSTIYQISSTLTRTGDSVTATVRVINGTGSSFTTASGDETFTYYIRSYKSPV